MKGKGLFFRNHAVLTLASLFLAACTSTQPPTVTALPDPVPTDSPPVIVVEVAPAVPAPTVSPAAQPLQQSNYPLSSPEPTPAATPVPPVLLSRINLTGLTVGGSLDAPEAALSFRLIMNDGASPIEGVPLDLNVVIRAARNDKVMAIFPISVIPGAKEARLPISKGLRCSERYSLALEYGNVRSNTMGFILEEPRFAERLVRLGLQESAFPVVAAVGSWIENLPLPPGASSVWLEIRDNSDSPVWKNSTSLSTSKDGRNWSFFGMDCTLPQAASGTGPFKRVYSYDWPSGLVSSWQSLGECQTTISGRIGVVFPANDDTVLVGRPVFRWQTVAGNNLAILRFSPIPPDNPAFRADTAVQRQARNGQSVGDMRDILPGLKPGDPFWWQVAYDFPDTAIKSESIWQRVIFQPVFEDFVEVLPDGRTVTFVMGSDKALPDQRPVRQVTLGRRLALARTALSNLQCALVANSLMHAGQAVLEDGQLRSSSGKLLLIGLGNLDYGVQFGLEERPKGRLAAISGRENQAAIGITWQGATMICAWLNHQGGLDEGNGFRLPTEAEWEYVAGLGGLAPSSWGGPVTGGTANYLRSNDAFEDPLPPYTRKGGPVVPGGAYTIARTNAFRSLLRSKPSLATQFSPDMARLDMVGNAWEWCSDWYLFTGYDPLDIADPQGPDQLSADQIKQLQVIGQVPARVVRGGAWNSDLSELQPQNRGKFAPDRTSFSIGMRLASSLVTTGQARK